MTARIVKALLVGLVIGLLFSLISPLAGVTLGALWAGVTFLFLCVKNS